LTPPCLDSTFGLWSPLSCSSASFLDFLFLLDSASTDVPPSTQINDPESKTIGLDNAGPPVSTTHSSKRLIYVYHVWYFSLIALAFFLDLGLFPVVPLYDSLEFLLALLWTIFILDDPLFAIPRNSFTWPSSLFEAGLHHLAFFSSKLASILPRFFSNLALSSLCFGTTSPISRLSRGGRLISRDICEGSDLVLHHSSRSSSLGLPEFHCIPLWLDPFIWLCPFTLVAASFLLGSSVWSLSS